MDVFKEMGVVRLQDSRDLTKKILICMTSVLFALAMFLLSFGTAFTMIGLILAGGALYLGYYFSTSLFTEYEYILTNGEIDFDKIIAQRSRKRLCTIKLSETTAFGKASDSSDTDNAETYVIATANDPEQTDYFIRVKHKSLGDTVIYFTPTEEFIGLMKQFFPRSLKY